MMFKNRGLRQLAVLTALLINLAAFLLLFVFGRLDGSTLTNLIVIFVVSFLISSLIAYFIIAEGVFNRVRPLYKIIKTTKLSEGDSSRKLVNDDVLDQVEQEVDSWVKRTTKEMEDLKTLEMYRRDYIGNVSHELKTPIFNIQGYIHTLLDGAMHDDTYLKKYLKKSAKNVDRLITIVEDLDTISRVESGALHLELENFILNDLVTEILEELRDLAAERNIGMFVKDGASQTFRVKGDRNCIRQVLVNLITNSIKYGKNDGFTKIGFYDMDQYILVEVSDNGIGLEEGHLKHVFDRFYRVDKSRSRIKDVVGGGSGLGLSIVKHLVEAHGQTITVRSTIGVGSTFGFTLEKA